MEKRQRHLDETEDITLQIIPLKEVIHMLDTNQINTASATVAIMHYLRYEKNKEGTIDEIR